MNAAGREQHLRCDEGHDGLITIGYRTSVPVGGTLGKLLCSWKTSWLRWRCQGGEQMGPSRQASSEREETISSQPNAYPIVGGEARGLLESQGKIHRKGWTKGPELIIRSSIMQARCTTRAQCQKDQGLPTLLNFCSLQFHEMVRQLSSPFPPLIAQKYIK